MIFLDFFEFCFFYTKMQNIDQLSESTSSDDVLKLTGSDLEKLRQKTHDSRFNYILASVLTEARNAARDGYEFLNSSTYIDEDLRQDLEEELHDHNILAEVDDNGKAYVELFDYESEEDSEEDSEEEREMILASLNDHMQHQTTGSQSYSAIHWIFLVMIVFFYFIYFIRLSGLKIQPTPQPYPTY